MNHHEKWLKLNYTRMIYVLSVKDISLALVEYAAPEGNSKGAILLPTLLKIDKTFLK